MNKLFFTIVLSLFPALMWSCSKDNDSNTPEPETPEATITVTPESLTTGFDADNLNLTVTSTADWSVRSEADWCVVSPSGGSKNQPTTVNVKIRADAS